VERRLFGTSGIRGEVDKLLMPELITKVTLAYATLLDNCGLILVGSDERLPSRSIRHAVISGLLAGGMDVLDLGMVPTPALLHVLKTLKADGAVMITGSHTPPNITGVLFFINDTGELPPELEVVIEDMILKGKFKRVPWNAVGSLEEFDNAIEIYINNTLQYFNVNLSGEKIAIDCCNGPQSYVLPILVELIGGVSIPINDDIDPYHRQRDPYPRPDNLYALSATVRRESALFGMAVDGDGDRAIFCDENGNVLWGDVIGTLFAEAELEEKGYGAIVCPINTSRTIHYVKERFNCEIIYTKVGPPSIIDAIRRRRHEVVFAFEETGKYIWPTNILYGDPAYALLRMIDLVKRKGTLSALISRYPKYHLIKIAKPIKWETKNALVDRIRRIVERKFKDVRIITIDGVKVVFDDGSWILFRPSGTEPVFRIYVEGTNKERAKGLIDIANRIFEEAYHAIGRDWFSAF